MTRLMWTYAISFAVAVVFCAAPSEARFLQTDPIGYKDDPNLYAYTGNDPTDRGDPSGLACQTGSHLSGNASGCESSNGDDEAGGQRNRATNSTVARQHPREYKAATDAYRQHYGKDFDANSSAAHVAPSDVDTCTKSSSCTRGSVFDALQHCPTPSGCSMTGPYKSGDVTFAMPVGMVEVQVDPKNYWIINSTIPGEHILNPGIVLRESVDRGSAIGILSIGIGTGHFGGMNAYFTPDIWTFANFQAQQYMLYKHAFGW